MKLFFGVLGKWANDSIFFALSPLAWLFMTPEQRAANPVDFVVPAGKLVIPHTNTPRSHLKSMLWYGTPS
jgi:hypothetical protein